MVFMMSQRSLLGCCKYEKMRDINFLPMPSRKTVDIHLLRDPQIEDGIGATSHSLSLLDRVCKLIFKLVFFLSIKF